MFVKSSRNKRTQNHEETKPAYLKPIYISCQCGKVAFKKPSYFVKVASPIIAVRRPSGCRMCLTMHRSDHCHPSSVWSPCLSDRAPVRLLPSVWRCHGLVAAVRRPAGCSICLTVPQTDLCWFKTSVFKSIMRFTMEKFIINFIYLIMCADDAIIVTYNMLHLRWSRLILIAHYSVPGANSEKLGTMQ